MKERISAALRPRLASLACVILATGVAGIHWYTVALWAAWVGFMMAAVTRQIETHAD